MTAEPAVDAAAAPSTAGSSVNGRRKWPERRNAGVAGRTGRPRVGPTRRNSGHVGVEPGRRRLGPRAQRGVVTGGDGDEEAFLADRALDLDRVDHGNGFRAGDRGGRAEVEFAAAPYATRPEADADHREPLDTVGREARHTEPPAVATLQGDHRERFAAGDQPAADDHGDETQDDQEHDARDTDRQPVDRREHARTSQTPRFAASTRSASSVNLSLTTEMNPPLMVIVSRCPSTGSTCTSPSPRTASIGSCCGRMPISPSTVRADSWRASPDQTMRSGATISTCRLTGSQLLGSTADHSTRAGQVDCATS